MRVLLEPHRRSVAILFFVFGVGLATWVSRLPTIERNAHLNNAQLGIALLGQPLGQILATALWPHLAARRNSAWAGRASAVMACVVVVLIATSSSLAALAGGLLLYGITLGTLDIAMNTQGLGVQRIYGRSIMSGLHGTYNIGVLVGSLLAAIAAGIGLGPVLHATIVGGLLVAVIQLGTRDLLGSEADEAAENGEPNKTGEERPRLRSHPILAAVGAIGFCAYYAEGAVENWGALFLRQARHASLGVAPLGTAVCGIGMTIGRFSGDAVISRWGLLPTVLWSSLLAATGMALALIGGSIVATLFGFGIFGLGVATIVPIVMTIGGTVPGVPPGWSLSRVAAISYGGQTTSPAIIGLVSRAASLNIAMATTLPMLLTIGPLSRTVSNRIRRRAPDEAPTEGQ